MDPPGKRSHLTGADQRAAADLSKIGAAHNSANPQEGKPTLRLMVNPIAELEAARREYQGAQLGRSYARDQQRVEQWVATGLARLADARAAVARAE